MTSSYSSLFLSIRCRFPEDAELPIVFYYSDKEGLAEPVKPGSVARCVIGALVEVRKGRSLSFNTDSIGYFGGKKYLGFAESVRTDFEYFLSVAFPARWRVNAIRDHRNWSRKL